MFPFLFALYPTFYPLVYSKIYFETIKKCISAKKILHSAYLSGMIHPMKTRARKPGVLGKNLRYFRKDVKRWNQKVLSDEANVSVWSITRLENGYTQDTSAEYLYRLAKALDVPMEQLMEERI